MRDCRASSSIVACMSKFQGRRIGYLSIELCRRTRHAVYFDIRRDVLSFDRFDMLCFFFQLCDNVYTFTDGRIPTLLLDLGERPEDWFDVDMMLHPPFLDIWRNDFLYKQTKFGLVDEIVVLNRE